VKPNQATFRVVVGALREAGELGEALRVYQDLRRLNFPADNAEFEGLTAAAGELSCWRGHGRGPGWWLLDAARGGGVGCLGAAPPHLRHAVHIHHLAQPPMFPSCESPTAERALTAEDAELSSLVASVLQITSATEVSAGGWEGTGRKVARQPGGDGAS